MEILLCIAAASFAAAGVAVDFYLDPPEERRQKFVYYTNLSNAVTALYQLLLLLALTLLKDTPFSAAVTNAAVRFSLTLFIFVTFIIYCFVLAPYFKKHGTVPKHPARKFSNLCVHYFAPVLAAVQWLLYADKDITLAGCFLWLTVPLAYFLFVVLRARSGVRLIGPRNSLYPYAFMDLERLGFRKFAANVTLTFLFFFALSFVFYLITKIL